ncbi:glycerophosphoryl diester phosphodiesterase [Branchiibius hedensis]|uniref:Glycerophosphoryl diester phosphodiesterase n=1 Tax=Branchiibius hedensis TaxID=672460 RepID=A0A2Y9BTA9_9MICO|nr:glycerophosphodiester phosphodiesterase [Branchiibius hedensis]PWJ24916.1 glycerophosphoryl diester phosphodiesterase [Branchiibius hedensis]SSA33732.1 glycerophosphoryl diester phosphodiesterase [Branchiibius hedensis]
MSGFLDWPAPIAMAHRGFSREGLENSRVAFAAAVELGYRYVETDVHATADGVLVAFHDTTLDRVSDGSGAINALPWSVVRQARIGGTQPVPTLDELFETWPDVRVNIDCKASTAIGPLAATIEKHRAHDRVCVAAFSDSRRRAVLARLSRPVVTSAGQSVIAGAKLLRWTPLRRRPFGDVNILQIPEQHGRLRILTPSLLARAHAAGVKVHVWTVNDADAMHRLLDEGVDGILTDRADLLKQVLQDRGQWA